MTEYIYRDAITGEFVTREYAEEHPDTTVREEDVPKVQPGSVQRSEDSLS